MIPSDHFFFWEKESMKNSPILVLCVLLSFGANSRQITKAPFLNLQESESDSLIWDSLNQLFGEDDTSSLINDRLSTEITSYFLKKKESKFYNLVNYFPLSDKSRWLSIAQTDRSGAIIKVFNLIAEKHADDIKFSIPLKHHTKGWNTTVIGNITYYHQNPISEEKAKSFDQKNTQISEKLGADSEKLAFYICRNYQEILHLVGFSYDQESNGEYRDGYGVVEGHIFSIMDNEDFSHDIFHYYSGKVNERSKRNWIVEEGLAYSWGNAYYTNINTGEMISQSELVMELKKYLRANPGRSLLNLFTKSEKIFNHLAPEISVRSTIASLICDEVEKRKGIEGIFSLINCGRRQKDMSNFFSATQELVGINRQNFNREVSKLLAQHY